MPESADSLELGLSSRPGGVDPIQQARALARVQGRMFGGREVPLLVGRYEVGERIGQGGAGAVYRARDPDLGRTIAIKLVRTRDVEQPTLLEEARAAAGLAHPNVVAVHDVGTTAVPSFDGSSDSMVYIVMEYVEGQTLRAWLKGGPATPAILDAFVQAGFGLLAAHQAELVHRDFKPENALVGGDGRVRVLDFGLARALGEAGREEGAPIVGTPRYMAPEQHQGRAVDPRTDQFSFCLCLYEALGGAMPAMSQDPAELSRWKTSFPAPLRWSDARSVPARVRNAILRGLAIDPAHRHPSMEALLQEIAPSPSRWGPRTVFAVGLGAAALVTVALMGKEDRVVVSDHTLRCEGDAQQLVAEVWNDAERARLAERLSGEDGALVTSRLDDYTAAWRSTREEVCTSGAIDVRAIRLACLERSRQSVAFVARTLQETPGELTPGIPRLLARLPSLQACLTSDISALRTELVRTPEEQERRQHVLFLLSLGRAQEVIELADARLRSTESTGNNAWWTMTRGLARHALGHSEPGLVDLSAARVEFEQTGDDAGFVEASLWIAVVQSQLGRAEAAAESFALADARASRIDLPLITRANLEARRAVFLLDHKGCDAAAPAFESAAELQTRAWGDPGEIVANGRARCAFAQGRLDDAAEQYRALLESSSPDLPLHWENTANLGLVRLEQGLADEAVELLTLARSGLSSKSTGLGLVPHHRYARVLAEALIEAGRSAEALTALEEAETLAPLDDEAERLTIRATRARALAEGGQLARARTEIELLSEMLGNEDPVAVADAWRQIARTALRVDLPEVGLAALGWLDRIERGPHASAWAAQQRQILRSDLEIRAPSLRDVRLEKLQPSAERHEGGGTPVR